MNVVLKSSLGSVLLIGLVVVVGCAAEGPPSLRASSGFDSRSPSPSSAPSLEPSPAPGESKALWSSQTRDGREALALHDFAGAEAFFLDALGTSKAFHAADVRTDVSFGNLFRLAALYERLGRSEDAERLLAAIEASADRRALGSRRRDRLRDRYEALRTTPVHARFQSAMKREGTGEATYDGLIRRVSEVFEVDPALVKAVVASESNFEPRAVSRVGAQGLMQLMPSTARAMGVRRPFRPIENVRGGVRYLRQLLDRFEKLELALAAYNAGPEAVVRYGGVPPYRETEDYVSKVMSRYQRYRADVID